MRPHWYVSSSIVSHVLATTYRVNEVVAALPVVGVDKVGAAEVAKAAIWMPPL